MREIHIKHKHILTYLRLLEAATPLADEDERGWRKVFEILIELVT